MKQTLRQVIEKMLEDLVARQKILTINIKQYTDAGNLMDAAINKIKFDTLETVRVRLEDSLNNH
jgi:hypothetical protein